MAQTVLVVAIVALLAIGIGAGAVATSLSTAIVGGVGATGSKQCGSGQFEYNITISTTVLSILCSKVSFGNVTSLPTGCSAGQYAKGVNSTNFICSAIGWTQLTGFPSGCPGGEYVQVIAASITCLADTTNTDLQNKLALYSPLNEGSGTKAFDLTNNGNVGVLQGTTFPTLVGTVGHCAVTTTATSTAQTCTIVKQQATPGDLYFVVLVTGASPSAWSIGIASNTQSDPVTVQIGASCNLSGCIAFESAVASAGSTTWTCPATTGASAGTYHFDCFVYDLNNANPSTILAAGNGAGTSTSPATVNQNFRAGDFIIGGVAVNALPTGTAFTPGASFTLALASASAIAGDSQWIQNIGAGGAQNQHFPMTLGSSVAWYAEGLGVSGYSTPWLAGTNCKFVASPCLNFNQGSANDISYGNVLDQTTGSFTLVAWVNFASIGTCNSNLPCPVFAKGFVSGEKGYGMRLDVNNTISCYAEGASANINFVGIGTITYGDWEHLACTFSFVSNQYTITAYINGTSVGASAPTATGSLTNTHTLYVGTDDNGGSEYLNAKAQEVRFYSSALTAAQVSQLATETPSPFETQFQAALLSGSPLSSRVLADVSTGANSATSTTLTIALLPNINYAFNVWIYSTVASSATANLQIHTLPGGASIIVSGSQWQNNGNLNGAGITAAAGSNLFTTLGSSSPTFFSLSGTINMGSTAGSLQIDFIDPAGVGTTTIKANSWITVVPVS